MNQLLNVFKGKIAPLLGTSIFLLVTIVACNETDKKTSETETSVATSTDSPPTTATTTPDINIGRFPVLCITKTEIEALFQHQPSEPAVFKLVFTANFDGSMNPSLTAFRAQNNDVFIGGNRPTLTRNPTSYNINDTYNFGNLELTRIKYYNRITRLPGYDGATRLLFYPYYNAAHGSMNYQLVWGTGTCDDPAPNLPVPAQPPVDDALNPCPPNQPGAGN